MSRGTHIGPIGVPKRGRDIRVGVDEWGRSRRIGVEVDEEACKSTYQSKLGLGAESIKVGWFANEKDSGKHMYIG